MFSSAINLALEEIATRSAQIRRARANGKPHLRFVRIWWMTVSFGMGWECKGKNGICGGGDTPKNAYQDWILKSALAEANFVPAMPRKRLIPFSWVWRDFKS